jgi:hypothetical protein
VTGLGRGGGPGAVGPGQWGSASMCKKWRCCVAGGVRGKPRAPLPSATRQVQKWKAKCKASLRLEEEVGARGHGRG